MSGGAVRRMVDIIYLDEAFYQRDCLEVAPELVGKLLCRRFEDGQVLCLRISETEAYRAPEDSACHAHRGKTKRNAPLYLAGGVSYIYLCYGIHWLLNAVTGLADEPQAVLIRACRDFEGPGKLTKQLGLGGSFNLRHFPTDPELWIADDGKRFEIEAKTRVGIGYAAPEDQARLWRFVAGEEI